VNFRNRVHKIRIFNLRFKIRQSIRRKIPGHLH